MLKYRRKVGRTLSAAIIASTGVVGLASLTLSSAAPAHADPGVANTFVVVGSNTLTDLFDAYTGANPYPGDLDAAGNTVGVVNYTPLNSNADTSGIGVTSWDAVGPGSLTSASAPGCTTPSVRLGGPVIDRPNGSGAGITALGDALSNTNWHNTGTVKTCTPAAGVSVTGQIDLSRSTAPPSGTPGTSLQFVPFARDALSYAYYDHGSNEIGLAASLSTNQLAALYSDTVVAGQNVLAKGVLTLGSGHTVLACALNPNSGTWKDFMKVLNNNNGIGVTDTATTGDQAGLDSGCDTALNPYGEENRGDDFFNRVSGLGATKDEVEPFSVASWIAQHNAIGLDRSSAARTGGVSLGDTPLIANTSAADVPYDTAGCTAPYVAGNWCPDHNYYANALYGRNIWVVLPYTQVFCNTATCLQNVALSELFTTQPACVALGGPGTTCDSNGTGYTAQICQATAQNEAQQFGFDNQIAAGDTCGDTLAKNSTPITG